MTALRGRAPLVRRHAMTRTIQSQTLRRLGLLVGLAAAYFVAGRLGLQLAVVNPNATAVWPPTGIALAALLLAGYEVWPAIMVGAFLVNVTVSGSVATVVAVGHGKRLEGLLGAYLVNRFARGRRVGERARDVFTLAVLAGIVSTAVSATAGVLAISLDGLARWSDFGSIWLTWWLGDAVGDLVVAPAVLFWALRPRVHWTRRQTLEAAALLSCIVVIGIAVFDGLFPWRSRHYPLEFLCVPLLLWAAFRFEPREAATAVLVMASVAIAGTLAGFGPFARPTYGESLLLVQAFTGVTAIMTLVLAAAVAERRGGGERVRRGGGGGPPPRPSGQPRPGPGPPTGGKSAPRAPPALARRGVARRPAQLGGPLVVRRQVASATPSTGFLTLFLPASLLSASPRVARPTLARS